MRHGRFDTDTVALEKRIRAHERYGSYDLNEWVFDLLRPEKGMLVLDLGCGTGKQTLPLAQIVGDSGNVFAIDISQEALEVLSQNVKRLGLEESITMRCIGFDDIGKYFQNEQFDRVLASYSMYYAQCPRAVLEAVHHTLKDHGILFFCGPAKENNLELKQFHYSLLGQRPPIGTKASTFMEEIGQRLVQEFSTSVERFAFENPLRFDSAEALYAYWTSYNLFDRSLDDKFKAAVHRYFQSHSFFKTVKRAIGIRAIK